MSGVFLAFVSATRLNQQAIALRPPLLVGFFLAPQSFMGDASNGG
jgi:hypothetical protein